MMGWRSRLGFLVPPGNPTLEPEMTSLAPEGVSLHFSRMFASGETGSLSGQEERNLEQIAGLDTSIGLLALVKPKVVALAHTATSYTLGLDGEAELTKKIESKFGIPFITAFGSVVAALTHLGVKKVALGTPYGMETTVRGKALLEAYKFQVPSHGNLPGVRNIYDETAERAYGLGRLVDHPDAEAIFISGVGMPTITMIDALESDLGKPVVSAASAMMWNALRIAGVRSSIKNAGRLLANSY
jgi:maleate cis-trans isomerase